MPNINWERIARDLDAVQDAEGGEDLMLFGSQEIARKGLAEILGQHVLDDAMRQFFNRTVGSELARSVLIYLRPTYVVDRCFENLRDAEEEEVSYWSAVLLRDLCTGAELSRLGELLEHPNGRIQIWGVSLLERLLSKDMITVDEAVPWVRRIMEHPNPEVRARADELRELLSPD